MIVHFDVIRTSVPVANHYARHAVRAVLVRGRSQLSDGIVHDCINLRLG